MFIVETFEAANGFGVMADLYHLVDLLADALDIMICVTVDVITGRENRTPQL